MDSTSSLLKSPFDQVDLTNSDKRQNDWLTYHHHELAWNSSKIPHENAKDILTIILLNTNYVYVRGNMKKD